MSYFEEIGGDAALHTIIREFVARVVSDTMIGFFFAGVDRSRLERMEFEHAAAFLGGPYTYSGRDIRAAHKRHPIMGGQYARRRELLRQTLVKHAVPAHVLEAWLAHQDSLRADVTRDDLGSCNDPLSAGPSAAAQISAGPSAAAQTPATKGES